MELSGALRDQCPKHMVHGPCGGVTVDGNCEVPGIPCPFTSVVRDDDGRHRAGGPAIRWLADLRLRSGRLGEIAAASARVVGVIDAVLLGEHLDDRELSQPEVARWARDHLAVDAIVTLTARDRDRAALSADVDAVVDARPFGVHAVTGDHPAARFGPGASATFEFDSFDIVRAARAALDDRGHRAVVTVAEAPASPPVDQRWLRAVDKISAGADVVICNHAGDGGGLGRIASVLEGAQVIAPVALLTEPEDVARLAQFPGLHLHAADVQRVLAAPAEDAVATGVEVAVARSAEALATPGVTGINLSGVGAEDEFERADLLIEIVERTEALVGAQGRADER